MAIKGQTISVCYTAWDTGANAPKTGDVANHALRVIKDGTAAAPTNGAAEVDATNAPGQYKLTLTANEMTCDTLTLCGKSSTANIAIIPVQIVTEHGYLPTNLDANVSSRLANANYTVPPTVVQVRQEMDANSTVLADIRNVSLGKWVLDSANNTLTYYKTDGTTILKTFTLTPSVAVVPTYVGRT